MEYPTVTSLLPVSQMACITAVLVTHTLWLLLQLLRCRVRLALSVAGDTLENAVYDVNAADSIVSRLAAELDWLQVGRRSLICRFSLPLQTRRVLRRSATGCHRPSCSIPLQLSPFALFRASAAVPTNSQSVLPGGAAHTSLRHVDSPYGYWDEVLTQRTHSHVQEAEQRYRR